MLSPHVTPFSSPHNTTTHARQVDELTADLHKRSGIPKHVEEMIRQFPKDMHAMSMFGAALFALQVRRSYVQFCCELRSASGLLLFLPDVVGFEGSRANRSPTPLPSCLTCCCHCSRCHL